VTEGMNRLAQALICLTDPAARAAYDAALGLPEEASVVAGSTVRDPELLLDQPPASRPYEVVEGEQSEPMPLPPAYEVVWEDDPPRPRPAYEVVEVVEAELVARAVGPWQPATRRELFARLAAVRRFVAAWQNLKPFLGDPRESLTRPARVLMLLDAMVEARPLLGSLREVLGESVPAGGMVTVLLAQPLFLHTFRLLLPDQRRAVAIDWRRGEAALTREYARLRDLVRTGRPVRRRSRRCRVVGWLVRTPEVALAVFAIVALCAAWMRGRGPR
jgi:hypothetical protein